MFITQAGRLMALIRYIDGNVRGRKMSHQSCGHIISCRINNREIIPEPRVPQIAESAQQNRQNLKDKVSIMSSDRIPDMNFGYQPKEKEIWEDL
jgi:hypothetical protein